MCLMHDLSQANNCAGVGPGRYRVSWWLRVGRDCNVEALNFKCRLLAKRPYPTAASSSAPLPSTASIIIAGGGGASASAPTPTAVGGGGPIGAAAAAATAAAGAAATAAAAAPSSGVPGPDPGSELDASDVDQADLMDHAGRGWYEQPAGEFEVPAGAIFDVAVTLWNHDSWWKRGLMFKELVLTPIAAGANSERAARAAADAAADAVAATPLPPGLEPTVAHFDAAAGLRRRSSGAVSSWQDVHPDRRTNVLTFFHRGNGGSAASRCTRLYQPAAAVAAEDAGADAAAAVAAPPSAAAAEGADDAAVAAAAAGGAGQPSGAAAVGWRQGLRTAPNVAVTFDGRGGARMEDSSLPNWSAAPDAPFTFVWIGRFLRSPRLHEQWLLSLNRTLTNYDQEFCWSSHQLFAFTIEQEFAMVSNYQVDRADLQPDSLAAVLDAAAAGSQHLCGGGHHAAAGDGDGEAEAEFHMHAPEDTWTMEAVVREQGGTAASYHRCAAAPYPGNAGPPPESAPAAASAELLSSAAAAGGTPTHGVELAGAGDGGGGGGCGVGGGGGGPRLLTWRLAGCAPRAIGGADLNIGCDKRDLEHNLDAKFLRGDLAVLLIYNTALTTAELGQLAQAYAPRFGF